MKLLITGASGFLGRHVSLKAMEAGHHVTALLHKTGNRLQGHAIIQCDLTDEETVRATLRNTHYDSVIHMAGVRGTGELMNRVNVQGTVNLITNLPEATMHVTLASSCAVYGIPHNKEGITPEDHPAKPVTEYGKSMLAKELTAGKLCRKRNISFSAARIFNLFGPGQQETMMTSAIAAKLVSIFLGKTHPPLITGPLHTKRDQIDVEDAAEALVEITEAQLNCPVNVGTGIAVSGRTIVSEMQYILGSNFTVEEQTDHSPMVEIIRADTERIRKQLNWEAKIPRKTTLENIIEDYMSRN